MKRNLTILLIAATLSSCSMFSKKKPAEQAKPAAPPQAAAPAGAPAASATPVTTKDGEPAPATTAAPAVAATTGAPQEPQTQPAMPATKTAAEHGAAPQKPEVAHPIPADAKVVPAAKTAATAKHEAHKVGDIEPAKALGWLKNGNTRFIKNRLRRDGASQADVTRLSKGQKPHTIVVSCSDSRVPPEVVFDQKLGEIFVVRSAGEVLEPAAIGSVEYAVAHLGARLILVMGHTQCGAVRAALDTMGGKDAGSPNLNRLVSLVHPHLKKLSGKPVSKDLVEESWANAEGVAEDLMNRSEIIREHVKSGEVQIQTALYTLSSGEVDFAHAH